VWSFSGLHLSAFILNKDIAKEVVMKRGRLLPNEILLFVSVCLVLISGAVAHAVPILVDPSGFEAAMSGGDGSTFTTDFMGVNDFTIRLDSSVGKTSEIWVNSGYGTAGNPSWLPSTVDYFIPRYPGSAQYTITFDMSLMSGDVMLLTDYDIGKTGRVQAFDAGNNAVNLSDWTFTNYRGLAAVPIATTWTLSSGNTTGSIGPAGVDVWEPLSVIQIGSTPVSKIVYSMSDTHGSTGFTFGWAPETRAAPIPEPSTMLLLGIGLVGVVGARKKLAS